MVEQAKILATFQPQASVNDYVIDTDGAYQFDVTDLIRAMSRSQAQAIEDDSYEADALWRDHPVSEERPHTGPFRIVVREAIHEYLSAWEPFNPCAAL